jgi:drug/metabolite transporter (DMT)-like permease
MFFSVFSCIVSMPFMIFDYHPMTKMQFLYLILAGASAAGGQLTVTKAYTKAPAKDISIYDYSQVIFAAILGFIFLGQVPDIYSVIGYIIIIGAAVLKWKYSIKNPV